MKIFTCLSWLLFFSAQSYAFDVYLLRHFEKQANSSNPELTEQGQARALALSKQLDSVAIDSVFSTQYRRTEQTAMPTAAAKDLQLNFYDPRLLDDFAKQILELQQNVVIVGHSNTTPQLVRLLGGTAQDMSESDYGMVFVLSIDGDVSQRVFQVEAP